MKKYKATEESVDDYAKHYAEERISHDNIKQNPLEWNLVNAFKKGYRFAEGHIEPIVRENEILKDILSRLVSEDVLKEIKKTYLCASKADKMIAEIQEKILKLNRQKAKLTDIVSKTHVHRNYLTELKKAERANKLNVQEYPPIQLKNLKNPE